MSEVLTKKELRQEKREDRREDRQERKEERQEIRQEKRAERKKGRALKRENKEGLLQKFAANAPSKIYNFLEDLPVDRAKNPKAYDAKEKLMPILLKIKNNKEIAKFAEGGTAVIGEAVDKAMDEITEQVDKVNMKDILDALTPLIQAAPMGGVIIFLLNTFIHD